MKKGKKILLVGLIGLMMAAGLVLAGCKEDCSNGGDCTNADHCTSGGCDAASTTGGSCTC